MLLNLCQLSSCEGCHRVMYWYLIREPSQESYAIESSLFMWLCARWRHWKCCDTQIEVATINHLHTQLQYMCSGALVTEFTTLTSGVKAQVSVESTIELLWIMVLTRTPTRAIRAKVKRLTTRPPLSLFSVVSGFQQTRIPGDWW